MDSLQGYLFIYFLIEEILKRNNSMKNLQQLHVKTTKQFGRTSFKNEFIRSIATDLLKEKKFRIFFKKKVSIFVKYKKDKKIGKIGKKIIFAKSNLKIAKILYGLDKKLSKKFFYVLIHAYIQWKDNFILEKWTPFLYFKAKEKLIAEFKKEIVKQNYKIAFFVWGSFLMKKINLNMFSDIDAVIIIDDKKLLSNYKLNDFLLNLFQNIGIKHYNFPTKREINWLRKNEGVARCGIIYNGIFMNFKILTKKALAYSIENSFVESLKESNCGSFFMPNFQRNTLQFSRKNSVPVYPFCFEEKIYKVCRGLIPEFLHTGKLITCNKKSQKELLYIKKAAIARSMGLIKAYNIQFNKFKTINQLVNISYTPRKEMRKERLNDLLKFYTKVYESINVPIYIGSFLERLYGEVVLPLVEKIPKEHWIHHNLLTFFLGAPSKKIKGINCIKLKRAFSEYFKAIKSLHKDLGSVYISFIVGQFISICKDSDKLQKFFLRINLKKRDKILVATAFIDTVEKFCTDRSKFYSIAESIFKNFFPKEHKKSSKILNTLMLKLGSKPELKKVIKKIQKQLKSVCPWIVGLKLRIRKEAGLYHHHLMKNMPLDRIDDIMSIQIIYSNKDKIYDVIKVTSVCLKRNFKTKICKKTLKIKRYKGYHFYCQYNSVPFEFIIRDLSSDVSIDHKIEHSIDQKKQQRLILR